jgi:hypothetical protein
MSRRIVRAAACGVALAVATVAGGCGGEEADVVKTAFERDVKSADVAIALELQSRGGSVRLAVDGPYESNGEQRLPSVDWRMRLDGLGARRIDARLVSTADNAFVEYGGVTYEVGEERIRKLERQGAADEPGLRAADLRRLVRDARDWFPESDATEDAELDGEPVTRVTGTLDLSAALADLQALARRPGMSGVEELKRLGGAETRQLERLVSDPRFTLDAGRDDEKLRRIEASMRFRGAGGGALRLSIRFRNVDEPVTIDAPASGRPIRELLRKLKRDFGGAPRTAPARASAA